MLGSHKHIDSEKRDKRIKNEGRGLANRLAYTGFECGDHSEIRIQRPSDFLFL